MKKFLLATLIVSAIFEIYQTINVFLNPGWLLSHFQIPISAGAVTLNHITAWFLLLVSSLALLCIVWVKDDRREGAILSLVLGVWWIGIGAGIYLISDVTTNLYLDSAKGLLLCIFSFTRLQEQKD